MPRFRSFRAVRPTAEIAAQVSCLPYDVMNRQEAFEMAEHNNYSFLRVVRSEIDLSEDINPYDERVYLKARDNFNAFLYDKVLIQDQSSKYYIYRQIMDGRMQTGLVGCASIDDYLNDVIKKHEYTRPEKEVDRINNFRFCNADTEPVFLTYKTNASINRIVDDWIKSHKPVYDFISDDQVSHILWIIDDEKKLEQIQELFSDMDYLFIADGHHRSASAVKVGLKKRQEQKIYTGEEEFNFFMAVAFPDEELYIMEYNRLVQDLNNHSKEEFLEMISKKFEIAEYLGTGPFKPEGKSTFGMYFESKWYKLKAIEGTFSSSDPVESLDASILQNNLLGPILGIADPRTDKRIDFVGGIRGLNKLENRVNDGGMAIAFSLYPVTIQDLMKVAGTGNVMPPKSTWFEPKLRSGLFIHKLD